MVENLGRVELLPERDESEHCSTLVKAIAHIGWSYVFNEGAVWRTTDT